MQRIVADDRSTHFFFYRVFYQYQMATLIFVSSHASNFPSSRFGCHSLQQNLQMVQNGQGLVETERGHLFIHCTVEKWLTALLKREGRSGRGKDKYYLSPTGFFSQEFTHRLSSVKAGQRVIPVHRALQCPVCCPVVRLATL